MMNNKLLVFSSISFLLTKVMLFAIILHFMLTVSSIHGIFIIIVFAINFVSEMYLNLKLKGVI